MNHCSGCNLQWEGKSVRTHIIRNECKNSDQDGMRSVMTTPGSSRMPSTAMKKRRRRLFDSDYSDDDEEWMRRHAEGGAVAEHPRRST